MGNCSGCIQMRHPTQDEFDYEIQTRNVKSILQEYSLTKDQNNEETYMMLLKSIKLIRDNYLIYSAKKRVLQMKDNRAISVVNRSKGVFLGVKESIIDFNMMGDEDLSNFNDGIQRKFKEVKVDRKTYHGEMINSRKDGLGKLTWRDGSDYIGQFSNDKANGYGRLCHADGDIYYGNWVSDQANGLGRYFNTKGSYEGYWLNDKQDGYGLEIWPKGSIYEGYFYQGAKYSIGLYKLEDGSYYEGSFDKNDINGIGTFHFKDRRIYYGEWKNNKLNGYGIMTWPDGKKFEGSFLDDKKEGFGVFYSTSKIYVANWKASKLHGKAIIIKDNQITKSEWVEGKRVKHINDNNPTNLNKLKQVLSLDY
jgi:hypothetical protein